ncbi:hypothetical protein ACFV0T_32790 [Streptomyces sp. NPDC059582]|uniref:hypothetical protein n=1 Tax=Streptomyces sp. NPDC059582 TaxID=3346875 RepID=UPI0036C2556E
MTVDQLLVRVWEFARFLDGLLARLDQDGGWCAVFWRRDPDGMQACLDGREVPPWDVVQALLQDLAVGYGPAVAAAETERARALHAVALAAYDARPGGRDALGDRLDVMLREQRYTAERQAELGRLLASATSGEQAEAVRLDLAWAQDDHERAVARCAELRSRMAESDRRGVGGQVWGTPVVRRPGAAADASAGYHVDAGRPHATDSPSVPHQRDTRGTAPSSRGVQGPGHHTHGADRGHHAPGTAPGAYDGPGVPRSDDHAPSTPGPVYDAPTSFAAADPVPAAPLPADVTPVPAPAPAPAPAKQRKRRRGSARFAGMAEEEAAPAAVPPDVVPDLPAPAGAPAGAGRTPRGARFAGAADVVRRAEPEPGPPDAAAGRETVETVRRLVELRAEGRSGEAHALLVEIAYWPAPRFPLLAAEFQRAGLGADWATLLWEAASLPADRLVAAADALVAAGRTGDGEQILRQGVARPAAGIGEAVLVLADEGRHREVDALLDAYVRVRTPEEAARSVAPDPQTLVPLLLAAARGVSDERHWDLVHALRVAGFTA